MTAAPPASDPPSAADEPTPAAPRASRGLTGAFFVSLGIFATKIFGVARTTVIAHYLGTTAAADAFNAATRIPNLLQNLFGEGALSASFIPVYSRLRAEGNEEEAGRVAGGGLALLTILMIRLGILRVGFAPAVPPHGCGGVKGHNPRLRVRF